MVRKALAEDVGALVDELLTLWKNADSEVPVVDQARAEHAKLL